MTNSTKVLDVPGFDIVEFLGRGAGSTIWKVIERKSGEMRALKRVVRRESLDKRYFEQVENEFDVASNLDHDVVRRAYSIRRVRQFIAIKEIHLIMEYCTGRTIQEARPESVSEVVGIFLQVAEGLEHMNSRGFVHADMKPNNILVSDDGTVKIIDLGQSCRLGTIKERIQGTPDFIAPEQVHRAPLDARTDVFNFGAALYWTLTGRAIPTALPKKGAATMKTHHRFISPDQINEDVPPALAKLIADCVEAIPNRRPSSMKDVRSRLNLVNHMLQRVSNNHADSMEDA